MSDDVGFDDINGVIHGAVNGATDEVQIVIVSGRSGSGKTSILNILEDFAFYVIDNLPLALVEQAIENLRANQIHKIALCIDIRAPKADLGGFGALYDNLNQRFAKCVQVIYATADEGVLVARFGATRRVHPLMATSHNLPNAIHQEIKLLEPIAVYADIKIDTSTLNIHELKEKVRNYLGLDNQVVVHVLSFGFKYGAPIDADFIFDVRILPNPHWQENLRKQTGKDAEVIQFFKNFTEVDKMADDIGAFLSNWLPSFLNNNRHSVTIAIGCTGGKHRSVYISERVAVYLSNHLSDKMPVLIKHREKRHW